MLLDNAIKKAKDQESEKVAISLKVSAKLKEQLQELADKNNISLNGLCASILESALDGNFDEQGTMKLIETLNNARTTLEQAEKFINDGEFRIEATNGVIIDFEMEKNIAEAEIMAITAELKRRGAL